MELHSEDKNLPIQIERFQFPIIPAYTMTINKSQSQTIDRVGIYLNDTVFSHGQLYVAFSRVRQSSSMTVFIKPQEMRQDAFISGDSVSRESSRDSTPEPIKKKARKVINIFFF
jgi:ATP-dependent exoDNAse (exonuclease V) alpha subunit